MKPHNPSQMQIKRLCARIRKAWSEAEHKRRCGHAITPRVETKIVKVGVIE